MTLMLAMTNWRLVTLTFTEYLLIPFSFMWYECSSTVLTKLIVPFYFHKRWGKIVFLFIICDVFGFWKLRIKI